MNLENLLIISFDGLNRSGKGTQISLLNDFFTSLDYDVYVIRGDGSRPGKESPDFHDPASTAWQNWQKRQNKTLYDWSLAADVLKSENCNLCSKLNDEYNNSDKKGIVLMDRSHISRWYMLSKSSDEIPFENTYSENLVVPDIYFILDADKETLIERASNDLSDKNTFRKNIIKTSYDDWKTTIDKLRDYDINHFYLDANKDKDEIHNDILNKIINEYNIKNSGIKNGTKI